ncbi:MAG: hypothetical protein IPP66_15065 [Anaerolineales bacterium]|nr:hypothetical protein [Anaerolineales bacterium]
MKPIPSVRFLIHFLLLLTFFIIAAQVASPVAITSPTSGSTVSGQVNITGTTDIPGFVSSQLDFSYASNATDTWFAIQSSSQPVVDSPLSTWDTATISDGDYVLRLRVILGDGSFQESTVQIKIQNDTPILTPTPLVTATPNKLDEGIPTPFLVASSPTPTLTPRPTPTPLATNAASLDQTSISTSFGRGALVILGLFVFAGLGLRFRRY